MEMRGRTIGALAAVLVAGGAAGAIASDSPAKGTAAKAKPAKPNVVMILTDDLSKNLVSHMKNVQAMQRAGTTFSNYYVTDSLCCPSRTSIFTGKFPHDSGVFTNGGSDGGFGKYASGRQFDHTFATDVNPRYRTSLMGKFLNGYDPAADTGPQTNSPRRGWSQWLANSQGYQEYGYRLNVNGKLGAFHDHQPKDYLTNVLSDHAASFIKSSKRPFVLEVATYAPHAPATPAPRDVGTFPTLKQPKGAAYNAAVSNPPTWLKNRAPLNAKQRAQTEKSFRKRVRSIQAVDRMIGRLRTELAKRGKLKNTYFVFTSDNGFHLGQHRLRSGKQTAFDHDINVPLIVTGPTVRRHHVEKRIVENIDLRPTFAALGGKQSPKADGHSFASLLGKGRVPKAWRTTALVEHHGPTTPATAGPDAQDTAQGNPPSYNAIRLPHATYVEYVDGSREYYDDAKDPSQLNNIYGSLSVKRKAQLHARLKAMVGCHGAKACWKAASP
jgi:N-acetylglucosamine-6-sulfatase